METKGKSVWEMYQIDTRGKSFRQLYEEAKAQLTAVDLFLKETADDLGYSRASVRGWLSGAQVPGKGARVALALKLGTTPEALFPEWAEQEARARAELGEGLCDALDEGERLLEELNGTAETAVAEATEEEKPESEEERLQRLAEKIEARSEAQARAYAQEEERVL